MVAPAFFFLEPHGTMNYTPAVPRPTNHPPAPLKSARLAARTMAYAIDLSLIITVHLGLMLLTIRIIWAPTLPADLIQALQTSFFVGAGFLSSGPLLYLAYFTILHAQGGQTIGKRLMGIQVKATNGELTIGRAFLRSTASILSILPLAAGLLWALVDQEQRTWHDLIADTRVVYV